jgi:hypothetical protein
MRVLLHTAFAANKKEPLGAMFTRVLTAFQDAGISQVRVRFVLADAPLEASASIVDRVLKPFPAMSVFCQETSPRQLSNKGVDAEPVDIEILQQILAGVPKSFPFHHIVLAFQSPALGEGSFNGPLGEISPAIAIGDSWWVSGRMRSLTAHTFVETAVAGKKLPPLPEQVAALFAALGEAKKTLQYALPGEDAASPPAVSQEVLAAVNAIIASYRERMPALLEAVPFPHDLPPMLEALQSTPRGQATGPKKPVLTRAFSPMGYECTSEAGVYTLRRRTSGNLTLEISLDVGTWSRSLTSSIAVIGLGFRARLPLPVSRRAGQGQYPIGDEARWQQIVDNLAVLVQELERSFLPAIEAAAGPSPEWFRP